MRGSIHSRARAKQLRDFSGLAFDGAGGLAPITPTDVDGLMEYHDRLFVFFETKFGDASVPYGQQLAMTRLVDRLNAPGVFIITRHSVDNPEQDIDMAQTVVEKVYHKLEPDSPAAWWTLKEPATLREICDRLVERIGD